ncbi:MAG: hypothetical protein Q9220_003536 [cf. Caloplaca sp. 1 TL-2023]
MSSEELGMKADTLSTIEDDTRPQDESVAGPSSNEGPTFADELIARCTELLNELEAFQEHLVNYKRSKSVEVKPFRNSVASELKTLGKLRSLDPEADRTIHTLRSSNLPFYSAVWDAAKTSSGLVAFTKRFYWDAPPTRRTKRAQLPKKNCALVDIVAQDGQQWIKVSTVTETRLLFELAKAGWEGADSDSNDVSDEDGILVNGLAHNSLDDDNPSINGHLQSNNNSRENEDGDDRVEIIRQAQDLKKASLAHKVHYKHPSITIILPKISQNPPPEVARIIDTIRSTGASVRLGSSSPLPDLETSFHNLVLDPFTGLTSTLNIDCTILLALVSDLSHSATTPEPWFHKAISRQLELEEREQLLPSTLWPAMAGRDLICTEEAAKRMLEIVETIGTASERQRTELLLTPLDHPTERDPKELRTAFAELSNYAVPADWNLPIRVVRSETDDISALPPVAQKVKDSLTVINQSVFLYGWASGWTTMSSNRTVVRQIEEIVEAAEGEQVGPSVWLCGTARSLVGKEKARRDGKKEMKEEE